MVQTVDNVDAGKRRLSYVVNCRLAGETGTAEIPTAKGYDPNRTITSFVEFGPADDPRFAIVVRIDEPKDNQWGETVTAPVFRTIAEQLLAYYRVAPDAARLASNRSGQ